MRVTMIIEDTILKDKTINSTDKLVYGIIGVLSNKKGYCYASNEYISRQLSLSKRTVTRSISKLSNRSYIKIEVKKSQRKIYITK